jgi:hypothetical protein
VLPFFVTWYLPNHNRYDAQAGNQHCLNTFRFPGALMVVENAAIDLLKILVFLTLTNQPLHAGKSRNNGPVAA